MHAPVISLSLNIADKEYDRIVIKLIWDAIRFMAIISSIDDASGISTVTVSLNLIWFGFK